MSVQSIDFISPKITFYYKEKHRHSSVFGGILTLIMVLVLLGLAIYYFWIVFSHNKLTPFFYKKYIYDIGCYSFNSTYLSHFIWMYRSKTGFLIFLR